MLRGGGWEDFIGKFLRLYKTSDTTIARLRKKRMDAGNQPYTVDNPLFIRKSLLFAFSSQPSKALVQLKSDARTKSKQAPRFLVVTNKSDLWAYDIKRHEVMETPLTELEDHYDFFLPWLGIERYSDHEENPVDRRAAEKMADLYDELCACNPEMAKDPHTIHVFLVRLLFCFFAEDTGIFEGENLFTDLFDRHTEQDGTNAAEYIKEVFASFDEKDKTKVNKHLRVFPYVNGTLFSEHLPIPMISRRARRMIINAGKNEDWQGINPDIFGSMFQSVSDPKERDHLGKHYTSLQNIMRVIRPLFLDQLEEEYERNKDSARGLRALHNRIGMIQIFDPACGSGNFLITAYKELRRLEIKIFERIKELVPGESVSQLLLQVELANFYGIEIDDFACEIARLSLWLAEHQMNQEFRQRLGVAKSSLPLSKSGNITCGNALHLSWNEICPREDIMGTTREIYVLGNPPYICFDKQSKEQKADIKHVFAGIKKVKSLDYVACWFFRAAQYLSGYSSIQFAFVATNSICQGQSVDYLWTHLLKFPIEIGFAYRSFKWKNNARGNAAVICVIVGMRNKNASPKYIYDKEERRTVKNINAYLIEGPNVIVHKVTRRTISRIPMMTNGSQPDDGKNLLFTPDEKDELQNKYPVLSPYLKKFCSGKDYIHKVERWCFWSPDRPIEEVMEIPEIKNRLNAVRKFREGSKAKTTRDKANVPYRFTNLRHQDKTALVIPRTTSENREYIPIGTLKDTVVSNAIQVIYGPPMWILGIVSSRMHMAWVRLTCGRLKTDIRYSIDLCYNTFPVPDLSEDQKRKIKELVKLILKTRGKYPENTYADLYDKEKMPDELREAHKQLDDFIDHCYQSTDFADDDERLAVLLTLYKKLITPRI